MTETLVSREGKMEAAMRTRERDMQALLRGNKNSTAQPARWSFRRALGWGLILALLVPLIVGIIGMSPAFAAADADEPETENSSEAGGGTLEGASFYDLSAQLMNVFSTVQDPSNRSTESEPWGPTVPFNPGSAGSMIGYLDVNILEDGVSSWALSKLSGSSDAMGYDNLKIYNSSGTPRFSNQQGFQNYAYYGAALNGLGFDETGTGLSMNLGGKVMGSIMFAAYHLVYAVDIVFWLFINILQALNPFRLFYFGMYAISPQLAQGMTGGSGATEFVLFPGTGLEVKTNALSGLVNWIGGWYQVLVSMAWGAIVPIFIGVFLIGIVLFKKMDKGSALKRLLIRMLFIGFGLPLLGSMYSATLDTLGDGLGSGNRGASKVVLSTYVDFETWAKEERLALPDGAVVEWDANRNQPSGNSEACARNTALLINSTVHKLSTMSISGTCGTSGGNVNADLWSGGTEYSERAEGLLSGYDSTGKDTGAGSSPFSEAKDAGVVRDLLGRYMSGAQVNAASFETEIKASMVASANRDNVVKLIADDDKDTSKNVVGWFEEIGEIENGVDPRLVSNPLISVSGGGQTGGLQAVEKNGVIAFNSDKVNFGVCNNFTVWNSNGDPARCNMSPLAMYNYLNTGFDATSLTVYSSGNVMSEATREIHMSVNTAGSGVMSFLYWLNSVMLLGAFIVVGLAYAFAMLLGSVKRGFQLITAVPFATLGAIAGIAKVIIYSMALVAEVLLTIFTYLIIQEILISLPQIIEAPLVNVLGNVNSGVLPAGIDGLAAIFTGGVLSMIVPLFSIVATLGFTIMALKFRKSILKAADEAVTKLVEKFLDTNATPATTGAGSGLGQGIASGVGAGAGAAAANRLMTGGGGSKGPKSNVGGTGSPSGITTGAPGASGGGKGDGIKALGAGGTVGLLGAGGTSGGRGPNDPNDPNGSGGGNPNDPKDPNNPQGSMGYASDDQTFGEKVRQSGLSIDGQGYGPRDSGRGVATDSSTDRSSNALGEDRTSSSQATDATRERSSESNNGRPIAASKDASNAAEKLRASQRDARSAQSSSARNEATASSNNESSGRQISAEDTKYRQDSGATSTKDAESSSQAQRTSETESEQNSTQGASALSATNSDRGPTNIGGTNSSLSARERMEAQAAAERSAKTESASSESQAQRDHDTEQNANSVREIQPGDNQHRESSQATATDTSRDRGTETARAERETHAAQAEGQPNAASQQNTNTDVRPVTGASIENSSNQARIKQEGGQEKLNQDNRSDQKNFDEQKVDQDNSTDQSVENKMVEAEPVRDGRGTTAAAAAGAGAGITTAKSSAKRGAVAPLEKKDAPRSASTPARARTAPPSTLNSPRTTGAKETPATKAPTRSSQARSGALSGAVKNGARGAVVGGVKGGATGVVGGPAGIAAGAARGAAIGGAKGVAVGAATGGVKGAVKKPQTKAPSGIKRGVASSPTPRSASAGQTRQGPAAAAKTATPTSRPQPPKGKVGRPSTAAPSAPTPTAPSRPQPPKSAPSPTRPVLSPNRAQPPKRKK